MILKWVAVITVSAVISYLMGSVNSSIITVKLLEGKDIRDFGSGNAGLTNTLRVFGKKCALITLLGDLLKGILAVIICKVICTLCGVGIGTENDVHFIGYIAGFFAVLGHIFPIYYGFKGGKGVLVGVSVFIVIDPLLFAMLIGVFAIVLAISRYVSLSSIIATSLCPFMTFAIQFFLEAHDWQTALLYSLMSIPVCATIIYMHRSNIHRLREGTENRFSFGKKEEEK